MPLVALDVRPRSKTQAADLQRLAYDAACTLSDDLRKAKSVSQRLKIVAAIEKVTKCWHDSKDSAFALRQPHGPMTRRVNGNGENGHKSKSAPSFTPASPQFPSAVLDSKSSASAPPSPDLMVDPSSPS